MLEPPHNPERPMSNPRLIWIILLVVVAVGGLTVFSLLRDPDPLDTTDVVLELIEKCLESNDRFNRLRC